MFTQTTVAMNYTTVLDDLRQKRVVLLSQLEVLENAIKGIEMVYGSSERTPFRLQAPSDTTVQPPFLVQRPQPVTLAGVAESYLEGLGEPRKTDDIVSAAQVAGLLAEAKNPSNAVFSTLSRKPDVFVRIGRGLWALTKWDLVPGSQEGS